MARTAMTVTVLPHPSDSPPVTDLATLGSFDNVNGMTLALDGRTHLVVQNPTAGAVTLTIHSSTDPYGRTGDVTAHTIAIAAFLVTAEFPQQGWTAGGGNLMTLDASATGLKYAAFQRPQGV